MKRPFLIASLALWKRRLDSRRAKYRHVFLETPRGSVERHKYHQLVLEAQRMVAKRTKQLHRARITTVGDKGVRLIKSFEGFKPYPYDDYNEKPWSESKRGTKTIGYGLIPADFPHGRMPNHMTEPEAARALTYHLNKSYAPAVAALNLPLNQDQFDALVSFVYNVGVGGINPETGVGRNLRAHNFKAAADHLLDWDRGNGQVLAGLARRRRAERELFLHGRLILN